MELTPVQVVLLILPHRRSHILISFRIIGAYCGATATHVIARIEARIGNVNRLSNPASYDYSCEGTVLGRGAICRSDFEEIQE